MELVGRLFGHCKDLMKELLTIASWTPICLKSLLGYVKEPPRPRLSTQGSRKALFGKVQPRQVSLAGIPRYDVHWPGSNLLPF